MYLKAKSAGNALVIWNCHIKYEALLGRALWLAPHGFGHHFLLAVALIRKDKDNGRGRQRPNETMLPK